jgi:hypothetical protein
MTDAAVGLADAVRALRAELNRAIEQGRDEALRFELGKVEMEFGLEIGKESAGDAGIRFWVVSLGAKHGRTSAATHRVTIELTPRIDGRSPEIADEE